MFLIGQLTLVLLIWRVVQPHSDEDEKDEQGPDDLHQELQLQWVIESIHTQTHTHTSTHAHARTHTYVQRLRRWQANRKWYHHVIKRNLLEHDESLSQ